MTAQAKIFGPSAELHNIGDSIAEVTLNAISGRSRQISSPIADIRSQGWRYCDQEDGGRPNVSIVTGRIQYEGIPIFFDEQDALQAYSKLNNNASRRQPGRSVCQRQLIITPETVMLQQISIIPQTHGYYLRTDPLEVLCLIGSDQKRWLGMVRDAIDNIVAESMNEETIVESYVIVCTDPTTAQRVKAYLDTCVISKMD